MHKFNKKTLKPKNLVTIRDSGTDRRDTKLLYKPNAG